jgi:hypothetical protein
MNRPVRVSLRRASECGFVRNANASVTAVLAIKPGTTA